MRRREFITLLGGTGLLFATKARRARAQQTAMPVIGFLGVRTAEFDAAMLADFRQGLSERGYADGKNVAIEFRWAEGQFSRLPGLAEDLVRRRVELLVTSGGTASARAAKAPRLPFRSSLRSAMTRCSSGWWPVLTGRAETSPVSPISTARWRQSNSAYCAN
jgi:hypothetical protein